MAAISITEAQVLPDNSAGSKIVSGIAGAAIAAGEAIYLDTSTQTWKLADADAAATVAEGDHCGIAMNAAEVATQKIAVQTRGSPTLGAGASIAAGTVYVVSPTAGGIGPIADVLAGDFVCILGIGNGSNGIDMGPGGAMLASTAHA